MSTINVLVELQRHSIECVQLGPNEVGVKCPFHDDNSPSLHINTAKGSFVCRATQCAEKGDFIAYLARQLGVTRSEITKDLSTRYSLTDEATVNPQLVEKYHNRIWSAHTLKQELYKRGLKDEDIRKHRLGEWQGRITIPVKNESGFYVNLRSYLPGAPGADKMRNLKGRAKKLRLYPDSQLSFNKVVICGGEMKAIVTARLLNPHGIGAVCATGGEGSWEQYLTPLFLGKAVWVMMDVDEAGQKASEMVCKHLSRVCSELHIVKLPLDLDKYPKGDVNDYVADFVDTGKGDLLEVVLAAELWRMERLKTYDDEEEPLEIGLTESAKATYTTKRIAVKATVTTVDTAPYVIPKNFAVECSRDEEFCALCPVYFNPPDFLYQIHPESPAILDMVGRAKAAQSSAIKEHLVIPEVCRTCRFITEDYWNVEDARLSPQLEITNNSAERTMMPAVCIGNNLELNESYVMTGRMHPHPMNQQSTLVISKYEATHDALSSYKLEDSDSLRMFQPDEWSVPSLNAKLADIYADFSANVTRVFFRQNLHCMIDLAYHSSLLIDLDDKPVKGWAEVLILGDSAQGKSEATLHMQSHYGLGEKVECKNASVAGLLGGLQQQGTRWFVSWGVWPTHDRRLVIMEEVKGASTDVLGKLTDMRSSGFAEIPKIERRRTWARTRSVWLSNSRSGMSLDRYSYGIQAVTELIGSMEDVRRFDAVMLVEKSEVDAAAIHNLQSAQSIVPHKYLSQPCRDLVLWCWTREPAVFTPEARQAVLDGSKALCADFTDTIPIVDRGSMRYKLARLSAALAGRTFSGTESYDRVLVRDCHVQWVCEFLREIYSTKAMGYLAFTNSEKINNSLKDVELIKKAIIESPHAIDLVDSMLHKDFIEVRDLMDWCQWTVDDCNRFISLLVRKHAIKRVSRAYVKTAPFIEWLRQTKFTDCPAHMRSEDF